MTEQTEARTGGFAADVGSLFEMWAYADGRECLSADLSERGDDDHSTVSSAAAFNIPSHVERSARKPVTWVRAKTKIRSKNSSRGVTRSSPPARARCRPP
jgi:hypothetical protein